MYDPYFTLNILRSSPRRHRGERTTTIPMKTPPLLTGLPFPVVSSYVEIQKMCRSPLPAVCHLVSTINLLSLFAP